MLTMFDHIDHVFLTGFSLSNVFSKCVFLPYWRIDVYHSVLCIANTMP